MRKLLILSGKGGTGKTTVASAFIRLSEAKAYADCDVDAPNLHLIERAFEHEARFDYYGMDKAVIDASQCVKCGVCEVNCRFGAITHDRSYRVDPLACEGCGVCERICPNGSIQMQKTLAGEMKVFSGDAAGVFSTAKLHMGNGTSGMLVTEVKKKLAESAGDAALAIIDGSPGIGCPVIASISGVDMVLIVAEPSVSGISDLKRIVDTAKIFRPALAACINKYDTNLALTAEIERYLQANGIPFVGRIPYDENVVRATNSGVSIVDYGVDSAERSRSVAAEAIEDIHRQTMALLSKAVVNQII